MNLWSSLFSFLRQMMFAVFEAATPTTPPVASVCTATTPATPLVASLRTATEIKRKRLDVMIRRKATVGKRDVEHVLQAKRSVLGALHADALTAVEDAIGALHLWPRHTTYDMQCLGCTKQLNRTERFTLFLFMVGNGASPAVAVELLLATQSVRDRAAVRHLTEMVNKLANGTLAKFRTYVIAPLSDWRAIVHVPPWSTRSDICPYIQARTALSRHQMRMSWKV